MGDELSRLLASYDPLTDWPNCATPDCEWKVCTWAHPSLCGCCAKAILGDVEMIRRYDATHEHTWAWSLAHPDADNFLLPTVIS